MRPDATAPVLGWGLENDKRSDKNGSSHGGTAKQGVHRAMKKSLMMAGALTAASMAVALMVPVTR